MKKEYDYLKATRWTDQILKLNNKLEKIAGKMPKLSKGDKISAMIELESIMRRAERLEYQVKNAVEVKSEI